MKHAVVLSLFALSCATAPRVDHPTLELTVPEQWTSASPDGAVGDHWWRDLGAAPLEGLGRDRRRRCCFLVQLLLLLDHAS